MLPNMEKILTLLFPSFFFFFFLYKWLMQTKQSPSNKNIPPNPPKLPIIGNLHQLGTHPHRSLQSLSLQYGALMHVYLGKKPILVISSAELATDIMKTHDTVFSSRPQTKTTKKLLYNGKVVGAAPYGEYWRQMKSISVLHLLSNTRVRSYINVRRLDMVVLMEKIQSLIVLDGYVNLSEMLMTFNNDVICRVAFGRKYSDDEKLQGVDLKKVLKEFVHLLGKFSVGDFIPLLGWISWINGFDSKVDSIAKEFDEFLERVVREHEDDHEGDREGQDMMGHNEKVKDFVDVLLDVYHNEKIGFSISRDSIKALIMDVFSGGTDTSYAVLEWAMTELLRHPEVMQELTKEVRTITGVKSYVTEDELEQMKYLKAVIKETLRLHPPLPLLVPRLSTKDTKLNGYDIPMGTSVFINAWAIHRDPALWEEPQKFSPERFLNSEIDFRGQDFKFIPFGAGRRMCPGISFAMANNELVLANLVHKFDWTLPGGEKGETIDMSEYTGIAIHRKKPLLVVATAHK